MSVKIITLIVLLACASATAGAVDAPRPQTESTALAEHAESVREIIERARSLLGVPYRRGGMDETTGLDCSGLVRLVFADAADIILPRRARDISRLGDRVAPPDLQPGDLVFFNTLRRAFSHVGIYLGNSRFLHAPSPGGEVRIDDMRGRYWQQRFNGARRIDATD